MIWYIPAEFHSDNALKSDSRVLIFDESPDAVIDTLLVRPNDKNAQWKATPDALDMSRMSELSYVGHTTNLMYPAKVSNGLWGFTLSARTGTLTRDIDKDLDRAAADLSMQVNGQNGVADQLVHKNRGTLLWVSEDAEQVDGTLRHAWVIAPVYNALTASPATSYDGTQAAFVEFKLNDPLYGSINQPLAITNRNYGFVTGQCPKTLIDALHDTVRLHPATS